MNHFFSQILLIGAIFFLRFPPAFAQEGQASGEGSLWLNIAPILIIVAVFYFLLIRPQQKRQRAHREKVNAVQRGDTVVLGGGIIARAMRVHDEHEIEVEIAEGVRVKALRHMLTDVLSKEQAAKASTRAHTKVSEEKAPPRGGEKALVKKTATRKKTKPKSPRRDPEAKS